MTNDKWSLTKNAVVVIDLREMNFSNPSINIADSTDI